MAERHRHTPRGLIRLLAIAAIVAMVGTAVASLGGAAGASSSHQKSGGDIKFGLEAETTDYCLSRAQLAISGIQVVSAIYDTLTVPNSKGLAVPYLAKSVTPNANSTQWTIGLRPNVKFQDGEAFDANAVKLNLDTYASLPGGVAAAEGPLFTIYLGFIQSVNVVDPLTVQVNLKTPVPAFAAYLYSTGRMGMMAPAQINGNCSTDMIGTGPFKLQSYTQNVSTVVVKNTSYWQPGFPKANSITFVPIPDGPARNTQLQGGSIDITHQSSGLESQALRNLGGVHTIVQGPGEREIVHLWLLSNKAPFNQQIARTAMNDAVNKVEINTIRNKGIFQVANGIFDTNIPGYLSNAGYPAFNLAKAQKEAAQAKAALGGQFNVVLGTTTDPDASAEAQLIKEEAAKAGINVTIAQFDQATLINKALAGQIDILAWRNLYGEFTNLSDADTYVWFASPKLGYLTNFGNFDDPQIQSLLDQGRAATTTAQATPIYQQLNKLMAQRDYMIPEYYVNWTIGYASNVTIGFPPLPDGQGKPLFAYGRIPLLDVSKS